MSKEVSEKDVRQLMREAKKVLNGQASGILIMKHAKGNGLFIKAAQFSFNLDAAHLETKVSR